MRLTLSIVAFASFGLLSACASGPKTLARDELRQKYAISYENREEFDKAIQEGNAELVRLYVKAWDGFPSFVSSDSDKIALLNALIEKGSTALLEVLLDTGDVSDWAKTVLLTSAVWDSKADTCYVDAVRILIQHGATVPSTDLPRFTPPIDRDKFVKGMTINMCPEVTKMILQKFPTDAIFAAEGLAELVNSTPYDNNSEFWSAYDARFSKTVSLVRAIGKEVCDGNNIKGCRAVKVVDALEQKWSEGQKGYQAQVKKSADEKAEYDRQVKANEEYEKTPAFAFEQACKVAKEITFHEGRLDQQRKIASTGGVYNKVYAYQDSSAIVALQGELNRLKESYKAKTGGRTMELRKCPQ